LEIPAEWKRELRLPASLLPHVKTVADGLAVALLRAAIKGQVVAAREITDRIEGKAAQHIEALDPNEGGEAIIRVVYDCEPEEPS
jgi:hypothetical protein